MTDRNTKYGAWPYLLLLLLAAIWGSSFILMKIGLFGWSDIGRPVMSGVQLGLLRICLAGVVMAPLALRYMRGLDAPTWGALAVNGFIGSLLPAVLFAWAQEQLPSAVAGMLNALSPLWTLVLAVGLYGTAVRRKQVAGLMLGFVGALGLMSLKDASGEVHWGIGRHVGRGDRLLWVEHQCGPQSVVPCSRHWHQCFGIVHDGGAGRSGVCLQRRD